VATSPPSLTHRLGAEVLATAALVYFGCGAILVNELTAGRVGLLGIGLVFGAVVCGAIHTVGPVSGAHLNPAVTIALASVGRFPAREVAPYVAAQALGGILAGAAVLTTFGPVPDLGLTHATAGMRVAFGVEAAMTAWLLFTILGITDPEHGHPALAGLVIGATIVLLVLFGGPLSGTSLNPARSLGPALVQGDLGELWLYLTAPVLGACAGAWLYRGVRGDTGPVR
jgi:MIP family channel proteins